MAGKHSKKLFTKDTVLLSEANARGNTRSPSVSWHFKVIIALTVLSLVVSAIFVGAYFVPSKLHGDMLQSAAEIFENAASKSQAIKTLAEKNQDIIGWLRVQNTDINCAVCQTDNDTYYINHNQLGKKSRYGALFLSAADSLERSGNDRNIVVFGNNMKDGSMFGSLKKYRNLNFYKQNPTVDLYYNEARETYIVFAVMLIGSSADEQDETYNLTKSHFASEQEFNTWYSETAERSLINTNVFPQYGDDLLTLVTVADDFDGARLAVISKKIDTSGTSQFDVSQATVNAKTKYPKKWYTERGLEVPY